VIKIIILGVLMMSSLNAKVEKAVVGGGCFWCVEALFERVVGVNSAQSGYSGGAVKNPTYEDVCTGKTGHAEVVEIEFDSDVISYEDVLNIFFEIHDPTTLNAQGADKGTQYRSVIFYTDESQKEIAKSVIEKQNQKFNKKVVTELSKLDVFYPAEEYHQDYFRKNPNVPYCAYVIAPKLQKLIKNPPKPLKQEVYK